MKESFIVKRFSADSLEIIDRANGIIEEYQEQGFVLTLRQLYYQFVSRAFLPNDVHSYRKIGSTISNARLAGYVDWDAIEDRTRNLASYHHYKDAQDAVWEAHQRFALDRWDNQTCRVEVWIEKEALVGVIQRVCARHDVSYFACRGYVSQSEQYTAGKRLLDYVQKGQEVIVLHLGDHDPSGIDMTRDNADRLDQFSERVGIEVKRIALNWDQIQEYKPPPNPAKSTDARYLDYRKKFGTESWELDALDPTLIEELIDFHIKNIRDEDRWNEMIVEEAHQRSMINGVASNWSNVTTKVVEEVARRKEEAAVADLDNK